MILRPPAVAGRFYPGDPGTLRRAVRVAARRGRGDVSRRRRRR